MRSIFSFSSVYFKISLHTKIFQTLTKIMAILQKTKIRDLHGGEFLKEESDLRFNNLI